MKHPRIIVISGPSGAGKTTLLKKLFSHRTIKKRFLEAVSVTTRLRRKGECDGKDYFFMSKEEFLKLKKKKYFLETQKVLDNYYGTPRHFLATARTERKDLVLCIDVKGAMYLRRVTKGKKPLLVFISVAKRTELYKRLRKRAERTKEIEKRVQLAKKELQFSKYYDYVLINQNLVNTVKSLKNILISGSKHG